jgi:hypothetical protein
VILVLRYFVVGVEYETLAFWDEPHQMVKVI